ncbi:MAG: hypothetical protein E5X89_17660 [Mesorhizobium sp.]|nr:MAG: hypothetical protein E5X88_00720 [Mesorhizobium sp.]TIO32807.1 MAG: hypothetical protein E5X89_17660 [Mesorhizobium sp.]
MDGCGSLRSCLIGGPFGQSKNTSWGKAQPRFRFRAPRQTANMRAPAHDCEKAPREKAPKKYEMLLCKAETGLL